MLGFWKKLPKPFFALAPMADVTDAAFRRIIAEFGKPDVMWTEFVSADGLVLASPEGKGRLMKDLVFHESERPIVAQFFSGNPENIEKAAAIARDLGFDGVDINMGCPDRCVEKQGGGAALIKNSKLARELITAAKNGAGDLPVSVKTRIGYSKNELQTWLPELLVEEPTAIAIHARTRQEMSRVPARWDCISEAVKIRNSCKSSTLIIGNGDVSDLNEAMKKAVESGADGIMLGRAIFGRPNLFSPVSEFDGFEEDLRFRLNIVIRHTELFDELFGGIKNFSVMKKHYKAYIQGWEGARNLRLRLMKAECVKDVGNIVNHYLNTTLSKV